MYELLTSPNTVPFSIAIAIVIGLFILEIVSAIFGATILGAGTDGPDVDMDFDFDLSAEIDAGTDVADALESAEAGDIGTSGGIFTWIGARDVPFLIWLVSFLTLFGLSGLILQSVAGGALGFELPVCAAVLLASVPALAVTRVIANWVALLMPKTETSALRARHLGGYHGKITQGTASRGNAAEVKIRDRHGNFHYIRVEPLYDDDSFPKGSEVTLIRKRGDKFFVI